MEVVDAVRVPIRVQGDGSFWEDVDDLPAHDEGGVVQDIGGFDAMLGNGELTIVQAPNNDSQERFDR